MPNIIDEQKDREQIERIIAERQQAIFGRRYLGASLAKISLSPGNEEKISNFLSGRKNFLIYCGNPGLGKTYFCAAMFDYAIRNFKSCRYWNESELFKRVRSSIDEFRGSDYLDTLKLLIDDEFVMIDDIGSTGLNEWRKELIFDAIDERYNTMLPTIITSNFSVEEFKTLFPERVGSRLFSKENYVIEILDGEDLRKQGK